MQTIVTRSALMAGSLARTPFRRMVSAAAEAGYDSMTIWPNIWRYAQKKEGLTLTAMRRMMEDHGLALTDADACLDWVPAPADSAGRLGPMKKETPRSEFFDVCAALGGTTVIAVHLTGTPLDYERDIPAFARLCDDAAAYGLRIALEFVGFANVRDIAAARRLVEGANRPNAGYVADIGHVIRGGGAIDDVRALPAERIYTVQLVDGARLPPADLVEEAMYGRRLPGDGDFDVPRFLQVLGEMGVRASLGAELYRRSFELREPADVMREMLLATGDVLAKAGMTLPGRN